MLILGLLCLNSVLAQQAPKPVANTAVTFHKKPKPLPAGAVTNDWKSFLGPTNNGFSTETKLAKSFPASGPPIVWEMKKGTGYSSPAISGDYLVFLHRVGGNEIVECLKADTGDRYWQFTYPTTYEDRYGYNNGPRASPVIDGDLVYTIGAQGKLHALKLATGQVAWKRDINAEFKVPQDFFGTASTPLLEGDLLILNVGAPGGRSKPSSRWRKRCSPDAPLMRGGPWIAPSARGTIPRQTKTAAMDGSEPRYRLSIWLCRSLTKAPI